MRAGYVCAVHDAWKEGERSRHAMHTCMHACVYVLWVGGGMELSELVNYNGCL